MNEIKITLLNEDECKNFFKLWGLTSAVCYATPDEYATGVGKSCLSTKHFSGGRHRYIVLKFENISRACADQMARHSVGTAINMQSGRYVNLANFTYHTPTPIKNNIKAKGIYENLMNTIEKAYVEICEALEEDGLRGEKVYECARGIAPMNHHTKLVMGFTVEALTNFLNKRLCVCSQEEIQQVARMVKKIVGNELPELKPLLVPICQAQLWCPESPKRTCGAFMQKSEVEKILLQHKKNNFRKK